MSSTVLIVVDGIAEREEKQGNAFKQADTPNLDSIFQDRELLEAYGPAVGLPEGYQGNSEVGHLHLGAGRRVPQRLSRINNSIEDNEFGEREAVREAFQRARENGSAVHLAGMISDGGIHSHIDHLKALIETVPESVELKIHCFTDGRDVSPKSAKEYIEQVQSWIEDRDAEIATVSGRYFSMDRDENWDRTRKAYNSMTEGEVFRYEKPEEAVEKAYRDGENDYFIQPSARKGFEGIEEDDELVIFNFRADRVRQITEAFLKQDFTEFDNSVRPNVTTMMRYRDDFENPVIFEKQEVENTLGEKIADRGLTQLRITESQKIPHVSYFFNGQRELQFDGEEREYVESDKIKSYDRKPEMHADEITDILVDAIQEGEKDFILINYPNGDLVGHTGDLEAAKKGLEAVDRNIGRVMEAADENGYSLVVTSDHGNSENVGTEDDPNTSHTLNPVPLAVYNSDLDVSEVVEEGELWEVEKVVEKCLI
ncbi:MAG: 2,3-bisphosphoglycerate-independent phosphoglycerate mutase [Candidatus Nanohaloarchaea archaeon]